MALIHDDDLTLFDLDGLGGDTVGGYFILYADSINAFMPTVTRSPPAR